MLVENAIKLKHFIRISRRSFKPNGIQKDEYIRERESWREDLINYKAHGTWYVANGVLFSWM